MADSDGDGLSDSWELNNNYSVSINQLGDGPFGDLESDFLANRMESLIGTSPTAYDTVQTIQSTPSLTSGDVPSNFANCRAGINHYLRREETRCIHVCTRR